MECILKGLAWKKEEVRWALYINANFKPSK